jgi:Cu-processing system permease protein
MNITAKITRYELRDVVRSRWVIACVLFFGITTDVLLRFSGSGAKAMLSLMNVVLFIVPLVTIVFGTMYLYNAREFIELLLAQPVRRRQLYAGLYLGLAIPLSLAIVSGIAIPFAIHGVDESVQRGTIATLMLSGVVLTWIFTALATLITVRANDRVKGLGIAIGTWLLFGVLYDGLVLLAVAMFADHPLERPMLGLMMANPIDLARVVLLLRFDVSALMGYTGAVFERFFGNAAGTALAAIMLSLWAAVPIYIGKRSFERKDF